MPLPPDRLFGALAHPLRLRAALLLRAQGELCVCELTHALEAPQPIVSRQLGQLRRSGLFSSRRDGTWIHYRLADDLPSWAREMLDAAGRDEHSHAGDRRRLAAMKHRPNHAC